MTGSGEQAQEKPLRMYGFGTPKPERKIEVDPIPIRPLFLAFYGAGEFVFAGRDEAEAARKAHRLRRHIELALPLVTPFSPDEAEKYREDNELSSRFEQEILANPKLDEMLPVDNLDELPEPEISLIDPEHPQLFAVVEHEETGELVYAYNQAS